MYLDLDKRYLPHEPWPPKPKPERRLTRRQEKTLLIVLMVYVILTVIAPIGGSSVLQALIH